MNGRMVQSHEEIHCERLQEEYLASKGIKINEDYDLQDLSEDLEYFKFVENDMAGE